jgi:hypothetical protein
MHATMMEVLILKYSMITNIIITYDGARSTSDEFQTSAKMPSQG